MAANAAAMEGAEVGGAEAGDGAEVWVEAWEEEAGAGRSAGGAGGRRAADLPAAAKEREA